MEEVDLVKQSNARHPAGERKRQERKVKEEEKEKGKEKSTQLGVTSGALLPEAAQSFKLLLSSLT